MSLNIDFKDLWAKRRPAIPDVRELYQLADKEKRQSLKKLILTNILFVLTATFIIAIWLYYKPQLITTQIGISVTILAMFVYIIAYNQLLPFLRKVNDHIDVSEYLEQLKNLQQKELFIQTTALNLYSFSLWVGIYLYIYEYTPKTLQIMLISYGLTTLWFAINWFYFRPKTIKKQQLKTKELIERFERIEEQLADER